LGKELALKVGFGESIIEREKIGILNSERKEIHP